MSMKSMNSAIFRKGYKAFVRGGRGYKASVLNGALIVTDSSLEPFDYMNHIERREWYKGVEYGREEKEKLLKDEPLGINL